MIIQLFLIRPWWKSKRLLLSLRMLFWSDLGDFTWGPLLGGLKSSFTNWSPGWWDISITSLSLSLSFLPSHSFDRSTSTPFWEKFDALWFEKAAQGNLVSHREFPFRAESIDSFLVESTSLVTVSLVFSYFIPRSNHIVVMVPDYAVRNRKSWCDGRTPPRLGVSSSKPLCCDTSRPLFCVTDFLFLVVLKAYRLVRASAYIISGFFESRRYAWVARMHPLGHGHATAQSSRNLIPRGLTISTSAHQWLIVQTRISSVLFMLRSWALSWVLIRT